MLLLFLNPMMEPFIRQSRVNINVVRTCDYIRKRIELIEKDIVDDFDNTMKNKLLLEGISLDKTIMLDLEVKNNRIYVVEKDRKFAIDYGGHPNILPIMTLHAR